MGTLVVLSIYTPLDSRHISVCMLYSSSVNQPSNLFYTCNETNPMHYLSSVYSVTVPLYVSGLLVVHHQGVAMYICNKWYVLYVTSGSADSQLNVLMMGK
jgi:hypothetical protein